MSDNNCIDCKKLKECIEQNLLDADTIIESSDNCPDFESKKLSIDELRAQFEKPYIDNGCENLLSRYPNGQYVDAVEREVFKGWKQCAMANNLIKDGE